MVSDGIYLNMKFDEYLEGQKDTPGRPGAMGSSKKSTLWRFQQGYFWKYLAPYRPARKTTPEQLFGSALHAALLEGVHAYETRYCVEPAKEDFHDLLVSTDDIKEALRQAGVSLGATSKWVKDDWLDAADTYLPDVPVWGNIQAEFLRRHRSREVLSAADDYAIRAMRDLAQDERISPPEIRELMSVGSDFPILAEISVFYTDEEGIQHCARFDKLLPVVTGDLKSVGEWRGRPLAESLHGHIVDNGYDVQLADYHIARWHMNRMLLEDPEGYLHGGTEEEREHLEAMAQWNQTNKWGWLWLFFQKPTPGGNAPILFPLRAPWGSPYHVAGFRKRHAAMETYKRCMIEFGPDRPWGRVEPIHYVDDGAPHHLILSPFSDFGPDDPAPGEEAHLQAPAYVSRRPTTDGDFLA